MRAAVCREYGPPDVVRVEEFPTPVPEAGQVAVRVHAAAVNFSDVLLVAGEYQIKVPPPFVPGSEFAGVVETVGEGVTGLAVGDRVFGSGIVGGFGEVAIGRAEGVTRTPDAISDDVAAAFGVAHRTSYHMLRSAAALAPGEHLVVLGAGGGVGLAAVQLGVALGATVTAVASSARKLEVAAANGATNLIDHRSTDLRAALKKTLPDGADVVIDPVGGDLAEPALRCLRWRGRFVTVGFAAGTIPRIPLNLVLLKGIQVTGMQLRDFGTHAPEEMRRNERELIELFAAGKVSPHIGATFAFEESAAALRYVADGHAIGKTVLRIAGNNGWG
ncbi:NADPH2:quinone reductase [Parafrankia irregularis]|uniref:NADPH2:quinone reductase n=1 Tax=Parafrankia irregularis TaxID=795642 RepID=A0A0S4QPP1_9ACTN|nr:MULTISPECIES: NADPH:quinone oxidoreductase family protein [Parafrankia]MBE3204390.1 NADPH:quinone oxidoreductase family protein [Parafrankia sp. CH37]CUU57659.1 NADPH2:quinone reductase [Parafrankia irregularis]